MTITFKVTSNGKQIASKMGDLAVRITKQVETSTFDMAVHTQKMLRRQLVENGNIFRKRAWRSITAKKLGKNQSTVSMSQQAEWLDRMKPHWVKLKRGRVIHRWAMAKGNAGVKAIAKRQGSIFVRPHPFVEEGFQKSIISYNKILRKRVQKALNR